MTETNIRVHPAMLLSPLERIEAHLERVEKKLDWLHWYARCGNSPKEYVVLDPHTHEPKTDLIFLREGEPPWPKA
jgi:hypothetical protein